MKNGILPDYFPDYQKKAALERKKEKEKVCLLKDNRNKFCQSILSSVLNYSDSAYFHLSHRTGMTFAIIRRLFSRMKKRRSSFYNART